MKKPHRALRVWAGALAVLVCAVACGEYAAMRYGHGLRCARPEMYLEDAIARMNASNFAGALAAWREAEARGPEDPRVYKVLGDIHHRMEHWEKAIPAYEEALRLGSAASGVRMNLLACYLNLERYDAVVAAGRRFVDEGATDPDYPRFMAVASCRAGRYGEAIPYLHRALEGFPNNPYLMDLLRKAYEQTGQQAKADEVDARIRDVESQLNTLGEETIRGQ